MLEDLPLRALRPRHDLQHARRDAAAGLLHAHRLAARPHLHRQARLKDIARELLGIDMSKQQRSSDWGAEALTDAQLAYAASDVLHLHALKDRLDAMLAREGRAELAAACFGSCRIGPGSTSPARPPRIFSPIPEHLAPNGPCSQPIFNLLNRDMTVAEANLGVLGLLRTAGQQPVHHLHARNGMSMVCAGERRDNTQRVRARPRATAGGCGGCGARSRSSSL